MPLHHSEPIPSQQYAYYPQKPGVQHHNSYPYTASLSMGYRSYSNDAQKLSPQQSSMTRTPSFTTSTGHQQQQQSGIPSQPTSPYAQRQYSGEESPQRQNLYSQLYYSQPSAADMPRSVSYHSEYAQAYPSYSPSLLSAPPPMTRHNTTSVIGDGLAGMDLSRQGPSLGYSFANRLPLVDRPFKCDECVQSFNRNHDLKRHKRIHLSIKPYGCDKCGKTFSRKDALRRHWLVKGCRGEDGATAPISQMYPTNPQATPGLSPPTPNEISPVDPSYPSSSFSNTSVPLHRQSSAQSQTQFIVTPDELAAAQQQAQAAAPLDEPLAIDPALSSHGADNADGYFEGVVGLKQDGTAVIDHNPGSSPYARYPSSPPNSQIHHHPYRRPQAVTSPIRGSPTALFSTGVKSYTPSNFNGDSRPVFAMPFPPQNHTYAMQHHEGLLAPPLEQAVKMEKQTSAESDPTTWQRWHRPSFPFPPPPGSNFNFDPVEPVDVGHVYA